MCGLVGLARGNGRLSSQEREMFSQLLDVAAVRGHDSTGVIRVPRPSSKQLRKMVSGKMEIDTRFRKDAVDSWPFLKQEGTKKFFTGSGETSALMGHTRLATIGKVEVENAHPFNFPTVIGMANGTVPRHDLKDGSKYATDSEGIYAMIDSMGPEAALAEVIGAPRAPLALVYVNKKLNTLEIFRNNCGTLPADQRPLVLAISKDKGTLLWASESYMLMWVIKRNGYELSDQWKYAWPKEKKIYRYPLLMDPDKWINAVEIVDVVPKPRPFALSYQAFGRKATPPDYTTGSNDSQIGTGTRNAGIQPILSWKAFVQGGEAGTAAVDDGLTIPEWLIARGDGTLVAEDRLYAADCELADSIARAMARANEDELSDIINEGVKAQLAEGPTRRYKAEMYDPKTGEMIPLYDDGTPVGGYGYATKGEADDFAETRRGPMGSVVSKFSFDAYLKHDCAACGDPIDANEKGVDHSIGWTSHDGGYQPICAPCMAKSDKDSELLTVYYIEDDARKDHEGGVQ